MSTPYSKNRLYSLRAHTRTHSRVRGSLAILGFRGFLEFPLALHGFPVLLLGFRDPGDFMARPYGRIPTVVYLDLS